MAEACIFFLFGLCVMFSIRYDLWRLPYLVGAFAFGVLLECVGVATNYYSYGHFYVMVGRAPHDVPLCVGAAWAIIMYTSRLFSDTLRLPLYASAALDALLALNIDLTMDVVAYRLHMWHWVWADTSKALTQQWFGVPYNNLTGWLAVVFFYSMFSRLFEKWLTPKQANGIGKASLIVVMSLFSSLAIFAFSGIVLLPILIRLGFQSGNWLPLFFIALLATVVIGWRTHRGILARPPSIALSVPTFFHVFFGVCFFAFGFYRENARMTGAAVLNLLLGISIHLTSYRQRSV